MIDIHTHILPYVDDGSRDMSLSIELIEQEIKFGVTDVFLTPHYMKIRNYISEYAENLKIFNELKAEVDKLGLKINLHLGNEIYATTKLISDLKKGITIPLGNSKFVLIEFSLNEEDFEITEAINNLDALGYKPIIAHPERYEHINSVKDYRIIKRMGAYIQLNAGSFFGAYGRKAKKIAYNLIKNDLVDFIASDTHDFRENYLLEAYKLISNKFSQDKADKLFNNQIVFENR